MSMQEQPDNDAAFDGLDRLFRNSAEEFEAPYDPVAWQYMRAKLDERDRVVAWGRFLRWGLALLVGLVLFSGGWYRFKQSRAQAVAMTGMVGPSGSPERLVTNTQQIPTKSKSLATATTVNSAPSAQSESSVKRQTPTEPKAATSQFVRHDQPTQAVATQQPEFGQPSPTNSAELNYPNPKNVEPSATGRRLPTDIAGRHTMDQPMQTGVGQRRRLRSPVARQPFLVASTEPVTRNGAGRTMPQRSAITHVSTTGPATSIVRPRKVDLSKDERHQTHLNPDAEPPLADGNSSNTRAVESQSSKIQSGSAALAGSLEEYRIGPVDAMMGRGTLQWPFWAALEAPLLSQPTSKGSAGGDPPRPKPERGLSIRFIAAPDISSVGLRNFTRPGTNFGLLAEYRIASRWVVQAGVMQSRKLYKALPEQYTMPANWRWAVMPTSIDGQCKMLDIPINIRYDAFLRTGKNQTRLFVGSGVTTYIMKNERYDYQFADPNNPLIRYRFWQGNTGRYNLSHLNLSVGYERSLGRRLAVQVEPFAKVPLRGVGQFKVNLFSTGALFSMRYKL